MTWGAVAIGGATLISGYMSSEASKSASKKASSAQSAQAQMAIDEQRRQFDAVQKLLAPYVEAGQGAVAAQQNLLGLGGAEAQQQAIQQLQQSPYFQSQMQQGENALLQNASATGGLRGGNLQGALAQFRPQLLAQTIQNQLGNLGGLAGLGQASAAGQAAMGQQTGANIGNLYGQLGAAQAGNYLAQGAAQQNFLGSAGQSIGLGAYGYLNRPTGGLTQWGTIPGSTQSQMLAAQNAGF